MDESYLPLTMNTWSSRKICIYLSGKDFLTKLDLMLHETAHMWRMVIEHDYVAQRYKENELEQTERKDETNTKMKWRNGICSCVRTKCLLANIRQSLTYTASLLGIGLSLHSLPAKRHALGQVTMSALLAFHKQLLRIVALWLWQVVIQASHGPCRACSQT